MHRRTFLKTVVVGFGVLGGVLKTPEISLARKQTPDGSVVETEEKYVLPVREILIPSYNRGSIIDSELNNYANEFLNYDESMSIFLPEVERWRELVKEVLEKEAIKTNSFKITNNLILILMQMESQGNPDAENPNSGASGLMQIMPQTYASLGIGGNIKNPINNIKAAVRLLKDSLRVSQIIGYEGLNAWRYATASYNGGPTNGKRFLEDKLESVPEETKFYVLNFTRYVLYTQKLMNSFREELERSPSGDFSYLYFQTLLSIQNDPVSNFVQSEIDGKLNSTAGRFSYDKFTSALDDLIKSYSNNSSYSNQEVTSMNYIPTYWMYHYYSRR